MNSDNIFWLFVTTVFCLYCSIGGANFIFPVLGAFWLIVVLEYPFISVKIKKKKGKK